MKILSASRAGLLLTAVNLFSQAVGFAYRVALSRMVGPQVMGLYQLVMPALSVLMSLTAVGFTVACSHLTAQYRATGNHRAARQALKQCLLGFFCAFGLVAGVVAPLSDAISVHLLGDARAQLGSLKAVEKVRGWKKAQKRILDMVGEKGKNLENQVVGACYGTDRESYDYILQELKNRYHVKGILEARVGCAIGAHTGPGILGIVFLNETDERFERYLQ